MALFCACDQKEIRSAKIMCLGLLIAEIDQEQHCHTQQTDDNLQLPQRFKPPDQPPHPRKGTPLIRKPANSQMQDERRNRQSQTPAWQDIFEYIVALRPVLHQNHRQGDPCQTGGEIRRIA